MFSKLCYPPPIEDAITLIEYLLIQDYRRSLTERDYHVSKRSVALLLLQKGPILWEEVKQQEPQSHEIEQVVQATQEKFDDPLIFIIAQVRHQLAVEIEKNVVTQLNKNGKTGNEWLHQLTVNPMNGFLTFSLLFYLGVYQFVGVFGAGTLVHLTETFFDEKVKPLVNEITVQTIPWPVLQNLFANDYGMITMGDGNSPIAATSSQSRPD